MWIKVCNNCKAPAVFGRVSEGQWNIGSHSPNKENVHACSCECAEHLDKVKPYPQPEEKPL